MSTINLNEYKNYQKALLIINDLNAILKILNTLSEALIKYRKYIPVKAVLKVIEAERMILKMYLKKYTDIINENNENKIS